MEWPQELLELFDDPLLDGVCPKEARLTADDRRVKTLQEITEWCEAHEGRLPSRAGADMQEKKYARSLEALRRDAADMLEAYDTLGILKTE